jgi:hypothetical protein
MRRDDLPQRTDHDGDWSAEFRQTRRRAWRKARWAVLVLVVSFGAAFLDFRFFLPAFVGAFGSILWLTYVCTRYYVCPACGKTPMTASASAGPGGFSYDRGVDLDPEFCPNCEVQLKPEPEVKRLFF